MGIFMEYMLVKTLCVNGSFFMLQNLHYIWTPEKNTEALIETL